MDKRDLRIDDWVNVEVNIQTHEMQPMQVKEILSHCIKTKYSLSQDPPFELLHPIEITEKLLDKISKSTDCYGVWYIGMHTAIKKEGRFWNLSIVNDENDYEKRIKYVHQLQHELWDAGIDVNNDNFIDYGRGKERQQ